MWKFEIFKNVIKILAKECTFNTERYITEIKDKTTLFFKKNKIKIIKIKIMLFYL